MLCSKGAELFNPVYLLNIKIATEVLLYFCTYRIRTDGDNQYAKLYFQTTPSNHMCWIKPRLLTDVMFGVRNNINCKRWSYTNY